MNCVSYIQSEAFYVVEVVNFHFGCQLGCQNNKAHRTVDRPGRPNAVAVARTAGLEPTTYGLEDRCSIH